MRHRFACFALEIFILLIELSKLPPPFKKSVLKPFRTDKWKFDKKGDTPPFENEG